MSQNNQRAPVGSSKPLVAVAAAASTSSSSNGSGTNATSVIIGVTVSVGSVLILVVAFRIWRCTRPPKAPLPPKGPLAHDRQRHIAAEFSQAQLQSSLPIRAETFVPSEKHMQNAPYNNYSRQTNSRTDVASIPPSSPSVVSSQAHLVSESDENAEVRRGRRPSMGSSTSVVRQHHGYRPRTTSNTGSVRSTHSRQSNQGTIRGPPHRRPVNIVLPKPLAPGLYDTSSLLQPHMPHTSDYAHERRSQSREGSVYTATSPESAVYMQSHTPHAYDYTSARHSGSRERYTLSRGSQSDPREREYQSGRVSIDGSSSSAHESSPRTPLYHPSAYPPPGPPSPTGDPTTPSTPKVQMSSTQSPGGSPNTSVPLLVQPKPSPDQGPPPPLPPKDFPPRRTHRRRHSESAAGRQKP
ncbi:hypothetical protein JB92DRAFT_3106706 [Gautieria morchelliformis]|nr:hypothetical protein JB92DRAFT_3106706 [Gautieria morchelliformis]